MRWLTPLCALGLLAVPLAACGDESGKPVGGPASVVGTWEIDVANTVEHGLPAAKRGLEQVREKMAGAPPEVRRGAEATLPKGDDAIRADIEKNAKSSTVEFDLRADRTSRFVYKAPFGQTMQEGVWELTGDDLWITTKTRNGTPVTDAEAKRERFLRRDGGLVLLDPEGNHVFWLKRR